VINLDRSQDRLAEFASINRHLTSASRIAAVDGQTLDIPAIARNGLVTADILSTYPVGAVGYAMTTLALWQRAIDSGQNITVSDDDAIFNSQFDARASEIIDSLPPDWDLVLWGWNFDAFISFEMLPGVSLCLGQFEQERMRANVQLFQTQTIYPRAYKLLWAFGMPSYTVSPKGALVLKRRCFPLRPMIVTCPEAARGPNAARFQTIGFDVTLNAVYRDVNAFVCFPPLVIAKNEHSNSTIQKPQ
jgi:glycosyl transferase family 25